MTTIGKLRKRTGIVVDGEILDGQISTLELELRFTLVRNEQARSENAPQYRIVARNRAGVAVAIGAAWLKRKRGAEQGRDFLSMTFNDPSFARPLNVAAFPSDVPEEWNILYRRRQSRREVTPAQPTTPSL